MKVSYNWLMDYVDLSQSKNGIPTPEELALRFDQAGYDVEGVTYLKKSDGFVTKDDVVIDLRISRELSSLTGMMWLANEVAALFDVNIDDYETYGKLLPNDKWSRIIMDDTTISIDSTTSKCRLFVGRFIHKVKGKDSPDFMKNAVVANGYTSTNSLIDSAIYATRNIGQPIYLIDADKLTSMDFVIEESASTGTITYNETKYTYNKGDVVVTCGGKVISICGVVTSDDVAANENTTSVIVLSYLIDTDEVIKTMNRLDVSTLNGIVSSIGLKHNSIMKAMANVTSLIYQFADGKDFEPLEVFTTYDFSKSVMSTKMRQINTYLSTDFSYEETVRKVVNAHVSIFAPDPVEVDGKKFYVNICEPSPYIGQDARVNSKFGSYRTRREPCDLAQLMLSLCGCDRIISN